jgi:hypothetical protein
MGACSASRAPATRKAALDAQFTERELRPCTKSGQAPVDGLHSIEKTRVISDKFLLTLKRGAGRNILVL